MEITAELKQAVITLAQQISAEAGGTGARRRGKRKTAKVPEYFTEEEIERFFAAIPKTAVRDRAIFRLMYHRGLRASEIGLFRLEDWRASSGRIFVRRLKGSRGGEYHAVETERAAVKAWLKKRGNAPGPLFPSRKKTPIERTQIFRLMGKYCQLAGIDQAKAHPHALKHSCGTHLSARENDIVAVQDHLGHAQLANTMKYVQVSSRRREQLAERLEGDGWGRNR